MPLHIPHSSRELRKPRGNGSGAHRRRLDSSRAKTNGHVPVGGTTKHMSPRERALCAAG